MSDQSERTTIRPQPGMQVNLLRCPAMEILVGGARGGGKTYGVFLKILQHRQILINAGHEPYIWVFRREREELRDWVEKSAPLFANVGAKWVGNKNWFRFPDGRLVNLGYLGSLQDARKHQGGGYTLVVYEELTHLPDEAIWGEIQASLRGYGSQAIATTNPGGPGHAWVRRRFPIDRPNQIVDYTLEDPTSDVPLSTTRCFLPATMDQNPALMEADPQYRARIVGSNISRQKMRAWLTGDWSGFHGAMFDGDWETSIHLISPFEIPRSWPIYRAYDHGFSSPFSVGWWAVSPGDLVTVGVHERFFAENTYIRVAEWYGAHHGTQDGLRMTPYEIGRGIREREERYFGLGRVSPGPADNQIWDGDRSIVSDFARSDIRFCRSDKRPGSRIRGWEQIRQRLRAAKNTEDMQPALYVFETCSDFYETFPSLPASEKNPDDSADNAVDHIADETRYMVLSNLGARNVKLDYYS